MADWHIGCFRDIRQTDLVGYSYGGFAALNYAMLAPDRIKKLILLSPAGGLVPLWKQFYIRGMLSSALSSLSQYTTNILWFNWFFYKPNLRNENTRQIFDCLSDQFALGMKYFRMGRTVLPSTYKDEELQSVKSPTLLLIGKQEALYDPVAAVKRAKQLIPNIQAELIPQASHDLPVSRAETVDQKILKFLKG